jgi:hypothetical protein
MPAADDHPLAVFLFFPSLKSFFQRGEDLMAECSITIDEVTGVGVVGEAADSITVRGTSDDCDSILVSIFCNGDESPTVTQVVNEIDENTGEWRAYFTDVSCVCGVTIRVEAQCQEDPTCTADPPWRGTLECPSPTELACPEVRDERIDPAPDPCIGGRRNVEITVTIDNSMGANPITLQWDFESDEEGEPELDGMAIVAWAGVVSVETRDHDYEPGTYTATLYMVLPRGETEPCYVIRDLEVPECPEGPFPDAGEGEEWRGYPDAGGGEEWRGYPDAGEGVPSTPPEGGGDDGDRRRRRGGCNEFLCDILLGLALIGIAVTTILAVIAGCSANPIVLFATVIVGAVSAGLLALWGSGCNRFRDFCDTIRRLISVFEALIAADPVVAGIVAILGAGSCALGILGAEVEYGIVLAILLEIDRRRCDSRI